MHVCDPLADLLHVLLPLYMPFLRYTVLTHEGPWRGCHTELPPTRRYSSAESSALCPPYLHLFPCRWPLARVPLTPTLSLWMWRTTTPCCQVTLWASTHMPCQMVYLSAGAALLGCPAKSKALLAASCN